MKKLLLAVLILSTVPAQAVREYYGISRSIRSLGMGGAFYGLSDDEYALFYNPAGLSLTERDSEFMLRLNAQSSLSTLKALNTFTNLSDSSIGATVDKLTEYTGKPLYGQVGILPYYFHKHFAVGLLLADTKVDFALLGKDLDTVADLTAISDSGLVLGYGRSLFHPNLHLGANLKGIFRGGGRRTFTTLDMAKNDTISLDAKQLGGAGVGVDLDLGATYDLPDLGFGLRHRASLVFSNLMASNFSIARVEGAPPGLVRTLSVGWASVFEGYKFIDNFQVLVDFAEFGLGGETDPDRGARTGSFFKKMNFGVEMPIGRLALRAGFHQGYVTAGLGINLRYFKLDFATYGEELGDAPGRLESRRFALTLAIGGGSDNPAPVSSVREVPVTSKDVEAPKVQTPVDPGLEIKESPSAPKQESKSQN